MSLREEQCQKVCRILDDVLANRPTERDSLIVATRNAFNALSAQPEIIRCKDCKHRDNYGCCKHWKGLAMGDIPIATDDNDFCSNAERREVTT